MAVRSAFTGMLHYFWMGATVCAVLSMSGLSLHVLIVHFPIVLAIFAVFYDLWASSSGNKLFHTVGSSLTKWAAISAVLATATGLQHAGVSGLGSRSDVSAHAAAGVITTMILVAMAVVRYSAEVREEDPAEVFSLLWLTAGAVAAVLIAISAIMGHGI